MFARLSDLQKNLSNRDRNILIVLAVLLVVLALYWLVFHWFYPQYTSLSEVKNTMENDINTLQKTIDIEQNLEVDIIEKRTKIEQLLNRFDWQVVKGDPILVLGDKTKLLGEKMQLISLQQGESQATGSIIEVPFDVKARGAIDSIQNYLAYLDNLDKALKPEYLRIEYNDSFEPIQSDNVWLDLQVHAFGAQDAVQAKQHLVNITGRDNAFKPTVSIDSGQPPKIESPNNQQQTIEGTRAPRYSFPTKQEVDKNRRQGQ
jgi:hypothetical protein